MARCFIVNYIIYALRMQGKMGNILKKNRETRSRSLGKYARASGDLDLRGLDYTHGEGQALALREENGYEYPLDKTDGEGQALALRKKGTLSSF